MTALHFETKNNELRAISGHRERLEVNGTKTCRTTTRPYHTQSMALDYVSLQKRTLQTIINHARATRSRQDPNLGQERGYKSVQNLKESQNHSASRKKTESPGILPGRPGIRPKRPGR